MSLLSDVTFRDGKKVRLRPLLEEDAPLLMRWMNDPEVTRYLIRRTPLMLRTELAWIENLSKATDNFALGIVVKETDTLIGTIGLHNIEWHSRTATTGTVIGANEYWSKGYGTEAKILLLDFAFNSLDLFAILSRVIAHNGRSLAYAVKSGYREVGRIPEWIRGQDGERYDEILLMITQKEWRPLWEEYLYKKSCADTERT